MTSPGNNAPLTPGPEHCPLCGQANHCGALKGEAENCWCMNAVIPAEALLELTSGANAEACICQRCAEELGEALAGGAADF